MDEHTRLLAFGTQLIETHIRLREALDDMRDGAIPPADLMSHCLSFCQAVTEHHEGEDASVFPVLAARHPELRELLDGLKRDHVMIAHLIGRLQARAGDPEAMAYELEGLSAILSSHFTWEEKRLVAVLNELSP